VQFQRPTSLEAGTGVLFPVRLVVRHDNHRRISSSPPIINQYLQYLVNVRHNTYKVTGVGDMYASKNVSLQVDERYQGARIIAAYSASNLPTT
jgi:hypothetical protein